MSKEFPQRSFAKIVYYNTSVSIYTLGALCFKFLLCRGFNTETFQLFMGISKFYVTCCGQNLTSWILI